MKDQIRDLITQNRFYEAIKLFHTMPLKRGDSKTLMALESRLNGVNEKIRLGILSEENATLEFNKVRNSLLDFYTAFEHRTEPNSAQGKNKVVLFSVIGAALVAIAIWMLTGSGSGTESVVASIAKTCTENKVAILVADFQDKKVDNDVDGFSYSLVANLSGSLNSDIYDVSQINKRVMKQSRYDDLIRNTYFENSCDTSGLFVNGYLDKGEKVFNVFITPTNLKMKALGGYADKTIILDNPANIEFSIPEDAGFLADMIFAIIKSYEGEAYDALKRIMELEKNDKQGLIKKDEKLQATVAYIKGNSYAMRGDSDRAIKEYKTVEQKGNKDLVTAAKNNKTKATEVRQKMEKDPVLSKKLASNNRQHSNFEKELQKMFKDIGKGIDNLFKTRK